MKVITHKCSWKSSAFNEILRFKPVRLKKKEKKQNNRALLVIMVPAVGNTGQPQEAMVTSASADISSKHS